ncbi:MAG: hypothetical protein LKG20_00940 [Tetrasphaera jenkinsii]|jgi:hypothetical protein|uniref:Uncharacterized protein n=1 Tax=Nostocoides jenkinsii Ben 74 TaxID=1193518 RepID=A0A077MAJ1_9MICO|nr:hypothetical protein [Tetrasphaera jenkinsii]MCI1260843.1 hypothetical protein [Tetrasphaera jenkinsii]CCI53674.1 conserved hypothetical protein [Tetrasphaera jenkinsii Ben 74]
MNAGFGLAVRWSLAGARSDVSGRLREYVVGTSLARFMFLDGLAFKVWRMRDGEWFEGTYVFDTAQERDAFQADFTAKAAHAPVSEMLGSAPISIEAYEVVAIAEGPAKFRRGAGPGSA